MTARTAGGSPAHVDMPRGVAPAEGPSDPFLSIMFPIQPDGAESVAAYGAFADHHRVRRLWMGESLRVDHHQALAGIATRWPGLPLGTAVSITPLRHPYQAAAAARSLASLSGAGYVAGIGAGSASIQRSLCGEPYPRPLAVMKEYATVMRRALDGTVDLSGEVFTVHGQLPPLPAPPVEVGIGVLRPRMAQVAGQVADAAITWLVPMTFLEDSIVPALAKGAAEGGRRPPRVVSVVHFALTRRLRDPRRPLLAALGPHLQLPHYLDMLSRSGMTVTGRSLVELANQVLEERIFLTGSATEVATEILRYRERGIDEVVLDTAGIHVTEGMHAAMSDLQEVIDEVRRAG